MNIHIAKEFSEMCKKRGLIAGLHSSENVSVGNATVPMPKLLFNAN